MFHTLYMVSNRHILDMPGQDKVANADAMSCSILPSVYPMHRQRIMVWFCHVQRMGDGRIQTDIVYDELSLGRKITGLPTCDTVMYV